MSAGPIRFALAITMAAVMAGLGACAHVDLPDRQSFYGGPHATGDFANIGYAAWSPQDPSYRFYPGDVLEVSVPSAPELARTVTVQPDGRITVPLLPPIMAADRSVQELDAVLAQAYSGQLLKPAVDINVKQTAPLQVFIGGEVRTPGVYTMPGDINALQGVILAGGFLPGSRREEVVVIRRGPDGRPMMRTVNLRRAVFAPGRGDGDAVPLRRFDVVYVPRTTLAAVADIVTQIRNALPIQFSYVIGGSYASN